METPTADTPQKICVGCGAPNPEHRCDRAGIETALESRWDGDRIGWSDPDTLEGPICSDCVEQAIADGRAFPAGEAGQRQIERLETVAASLPPREAWRPESDKDSEGDTHSAAAPTDQTAPDPRTAALAVWPAGTNREPRWFIGLRGGIELRRGALLLRNMPGIDWVVMTPHAGDDSPEEVSGLEPFGASQGLSPLSLNKAQALELLLETN